MKDTTKLTRAQLHEYLASYATELKADITEDESLRIRLLLHHPEDAEFIKRELAGFTCNVRCSIVKVIE